MLNVEFPTHSVRDKKLNFCDKSQKKMMNIGPEKGKTLGSFLDECLQANRTKNSDTFVFVELGTYCGYSCLRFLHRMLQVLEVGQFHIFTVDVEHETIRIAKEFVTMAGMQDCVTFLHLPETRLSGEAQQLSSMLLSNIQDQFPLLLKSIPVPQIDFLFIDHVKEAYLPDLKQLESKGFIQKGTYVAADNVLFHGIDDYRTHVGKLADQGIADSRLVEGSMEYVNDQTLLREHQLSQARDGIGKFAVDELFPFFSASPHTAFAELTIYSKNPCSD